MFDLLNHQGWDLNKSHLSGFWCHPRILFSKHSEPSQVNMYSAKQINNVLMQLSGTMKEGKED